jgi:hypothetical protein
LRKKAMGNAHYTALRQPLDCRCIGPNVEE